MIRDDYYMPRHARFDPTLFGDTLRLYNQEFIERDLLLLSSDFGRECFLICFYLLRFAALSVEIRATTLHKEITKEEYLKLLNAIFLLRMTYNSSRFILEETLVEYETCIWQDWEDEAKEYAADMRNIYGCPQ